MLFFDLHHPVITLNKDCRLRAQKNQTQLSEEDAFHLNALLRRQSSAFRHLVWWNGATRWLKSHENRLGFSFRNKDCSINSWEMLHFSKVSGEFTHNYQGRCGCLQRAITPIHAGRGTFFWGENTAYKLNRAIIQRSHSYNRRRSSSTAPLRAIMCVKLHVCAFDSPSWKPVLWNNP